MNDPGPAIGLEEQIRDVKNCIWLHNMLPFHRDSRECERLRAKLVELLSEREAAHRAIGAAERKP